MSTIPTSVTEEQFETYIRPYLSTAKRGYVSRIPLYKVFHYILYGLHTGCQWDELPIEKVIGEPEKKELSYHAVYYHNRKWSRDGSLGRVFACGPDRYASLEFGWKPCHR
jgi:transposase